MQRARIETPFVYGQKVFSFQLNPSFRTDLIHQWWIKSLRDEIRLRREIRTDLISSAKQISSERSEDFIAHRAISLKGLLHRDISLTNVFIKHYDDVDVVKIGDFGLVKVPDSTLTSLQSELKGSLNDPDLINVGFANYDMCHETFTVCYEYAITSQKILIFKLKFI